MSDKKADGVAANPRTMVAVSDTSDFANLLDTAKFNHLWRVAELFARSKLVPKHFQENPEDCFIATQMAVRLGVDPFMFMQNTYVTGGKPGMEGKLAIALINSRGPFIGPIQFQLSGDGDQRKCRAYATHRETNEVCEMEVSIAMAKAEGWYGRNPKWQNLPDLMLRYRAGAWLGRLFAPECLMGMQTSEELQDVEEEDRARSAKDITPARPAMEQYAAGGPPSGSAAKKDPEPFVAVDGDGVEQSFDDPLAAHDAVARALKGAGDDRILDGIWEGNALLMSQLRERGLTATADSLRTVYDGALDMLAQARQKELDTKNEAEAKKKAAAEKKAPAADARKDAPAADAGRQEASAGAAATGKPDRPAPPADAAAGREAHPDRKNAWFAGRSYEMTPPTNGEKTVWSDFDNWMCSAALHSMTLDEIDKLVSDNQPHLTKMSTEAKTGHGGVMRHIKEQRAQIEKAIAAAGEADAGAGYGGGR